MRRALLLILLITLCAAANILIAWSCARWDEKHSVGYDATSTPVTTVPPDAAEYVNAPNYASSFGPGRETGLKKEVRRSMVCTITSYTRWHDNDSMFGYRRSHSLHQFGLPFRSMERSERIWENPAADPEVGFWRLPDSRGGWPIAPEPAKRSWPDAAFDRPAHIYPITIIPTGFLLNTLLYILTAFAIIKGPGSARAWLRRRRNLCIKCAYPRTTSAICPECGHRAEVQAV